MNSKNRLSNSLRNIFFGLLKYSIMIVIPFIIRTIIIYKLGTEYAGITSLFSSILQVLSLSELGFSTAVVYALYEPVAKNDTDRICALLSFFRKVYKFCGTFILVVGLCVTPFVKYLISGTYPGAINIYVVFVLLLLNTAISYLGCAYKSVLFTANQRDDILSKSAIASNFVMYLMQIISLLVFSDYYAYTFSMIVGTLINNYIMHLYAKKMYPQVYCRGKIDAKEQRAIVKSVGALFGHQLDMIVINSADNIVISMFLGLNMLTIYNNYYYILNALLNILVMISNSFAGSIGNSIAIEKKEKNYKNFIDFTYFVGMISSLCVILLFVLYQDFMRLWMGDSMLLSLGLVFLISFSLYVRQFRRTLIIYKIAAGIWSKDALKPYVACFTNLILNIVFVRYWGLYGVILSTIFTFVAIEIPWEMIVFFKGYFNGGVYKYLKTQLNLFIKTVCIGLVIYWISSLFCVDNYAMFFVKAVCIGVLTILMFIVVSFRDAEFEYIIDKLKAVLRRKGK